MAIIQTEASLDVQVLHVLGQNKEIALGIYEKYFGDAPETLTEERALAFWEHLEGRRDWDGVAQIEDWYGALLLGPILQLEGWIKQPAPFIVPSGMVFGRLVQIGLLIAESVEKLKALKNEIDNGGPIDPDAQRTVAQELARRAVSQRFDQKVKQGWQDHCSKALEAGLKIERLGDLLDIPGYDPAVTKIQQATLRRWATEVGVIFRAGRPKNG